MIQSTIYFLGPYEGDPADNKKVVSGLMKRATKKGAFCLSSIVNEADLDLPESLRTRRSTEFIYQLDGRKDAVVVFDQSSRAALEVVRAKSRNIAVLEPTQVATFLDEITNQGRKPALQLIGPMSGHLNYNYPMFSMAAKKWRDRGAFVYNPAEITGAGASDDWAYFMRRNIMSLMESNYGVLLPGWDKSCGSIYEHFTCVAFGLGLIQDQPLKLISEGSVNVSSSESRPNLSDLEHALAEDKACLARVYSRR